MSQLTLYAAGRPIPDAIDLIRRYCGLDWSGGSPEIWAWHYYDRVPSASPYEVTPVDVLCAGSLHSGLSRGELQWFYARADDLTSWLQVVPVDQPLFALDDDQLELVASLIERFDGVSPTLLSKVLHRKRPNVVPLLDRHVIDWYRPLTGERRAIAAWRPFVEALYAEDQEPEARLVSAIALAEVQRELRAAAPDNPPLTWLRAKDIGIWMAHRTATDGKLA